MAYINPALMRPSEDNVSEIQREIGKHDLFRKWAESWSPMRRARTLQIMRRDHLRGINEWAVLHIIEELVQRDHEALAA